MLKETLLFLVFLMSILLIFVVIIVILSWKRIEIGKYVINPYNLFKNNKIVNYNFKINDSQFLKKLTHDDLPDNDEYKLYTLMNEDNNIELYNIIADFNVAKKINIKTNKETGGLLIYSIPNHVLVEHYEKVDDINLFIGDYLFVYYTKLNDPKLKITISQ